MSGIFYASREDVKSALDFKETARNNVQIDRLIDSASRSIEGLTHRKFYPWTGTKVLDWPSPDSVAGYRLWLNQFEVISVSSLTSGGISLAGKYFLEPASSGPPFTHIDIDISSGGFFQPGSTWQHSVSLTGVFGGSPIDEESAGILAGALDSTQVSINISNSAVAGVGDLVRVDQERMQVRGKLMLTTAQTLQAALGASNGETGVSVTTGTAYAVGETILLDAEKMLIVDIAGNTLIVKRAWDGSVLATHAGSTIYAPRTLLVTRGVLGTTAATHLSAAVVNKYLFPSLVRQLAIAEAVSGLQQEGSAYGRTIGSGDNQREAAGKGIADLREQVYTVHGRKVRMRRI
jgi:hypothetical protein